MNEKMDLKKLLYILRRRTMTILTTFLVLLGISAAATLFFMEQVYEANEFILIGSLKNDEVNFDTQKVNRMMASSMDLVGSSVVLDKVQKELGISKNDLLEQTAIKNNQNSQIINISVRDKDPEKAKLIASSLAAISSEEIISMLNVQEVEVLNNAGSNNEKVGNHILNIAIGGMIGLLAGIGLALLRDYLDDTVRDKSELESGLGLSVIGEVTMDDKKIIQRYKRVEKELSIIQGKGGKINAPSNAGN